MRSVVRLIPALPAILVLLLPIATGGARHAEAEQLHTERPRAEGLPAEVLPAERQQRQQLTLRETVAPAERPVRMADLFLEASGRVQAETSSGNAAGRTRHSSAGDEESPSGDQVAHFFQGPFPNAESLFGERAALIPLWEIRAALSGSGHRAPVLVGRQIHYLPPEKSGAERKLLRKMLTELGRTTGGQRVEIELGRVPAGIARELKGDGPFQVDLSISSELLRGSGGTLERRCIVRSGGRVLGVCPVTIHPFRTAAAAPSRLERGRIVELSDFPRRSVPARELPVSAGSYPLSGRYRVERSVRAGELISGGAVSPEPAVRASSQVRVLLRSGGIELRVDGRALASGEVGETIAVRLATGARLDARITGRGTLEIER
jgi:flagella basal body P-ring formation protein FlgA